MIWKSYEVKPLIQIDKMYSMFWQRFDKGFNFRGESHNFWECMYIVKGDVCVTGDERVMMLSGGDIVFHKPLELHKFSVDSEDGAEVFIFSYSMSGKLEDAMRDKVVRLDDFQKSIAQSMLSYMLKTCENYGEAKQSDRHILGHRLFTKVPELLPMTAAYICQLIISLSGTESRYEQSRAQSAEIFTKAVGFLSGNVSSKITVVDIARYVNASESSVKRIFARYANMGMHRYFLLLKIQAATGLLQKGFSIGDVAERLGFSSQGYFSACYKRETGQNPSEVKG